MASSSFVRKRERAYKKECLDTGGAFLDLGTNILPEAHILYRYKILVSAMVNRLVDCCGTLCLLAVGR